MLSLRAEEISCTFSDFHFVTSIPIPSCKWLFFILVIDYVGYWAGIYSDICPYRMALGEGTYLPTGMFHVSISVMGGWGVQAT